MHIITYLIINYIAKHGTKADFSVDDAKVTITTNVAKVIYNEIKETKLQSSVSYCMR